MTVRRARAHALMSSAHSGATLLAGGIGHPSIRPTRIARATRPARTWGQAPPGTRRSAGLAASLTSLALLRDGSLLRTAPSYRGTPPADEPTRADPRQRTPR